MVAGQKFILFSLIGSSAFGEYSIACVFDKAIPFSQVVAHSLAHGLVLICHISWEVIMFRHGLGLGLGLGIQPLKSSTALPCKPPTRLQGLRTDRLKATVQPAFG